MKKEFFLLIVFFLTACNTAVPRHTQEIAFFIPHKAEPTEADFEDFSATVFPEKCVWFSLSHVVDGDTIVLGDDTKVRFIGIDTPETVHPEKPVQFCGPEASNWTKNVFNEDKKVCLIFDPISDERDIYGRRLAYPFTEEGIDTTAELLKQGLARGYFYFPFSRKTEFQWYQEQAKNSQKGIWSKQRDTPECENV